MPWSRRRCPSVTDIPAARRALEPALRKVGDALNAIPDAVMSRLPANTQARLKGLRSQIETLSSPIAREVRGATNVAAQRLRVSAERLRAVVDAPIGRRPPVSTYMMAAQQARHLDDFDSGIVRVTSRANVERFDALGPSGSFVASLRDFRAIATEANGNLAVIERRLGLDPGTLKSDDTMIALIDREDSPSLRLPSGNERGVNDKWVPGGYTNDNTVEAVMRFPKGLDYKGIKVP